MNAAQVETSRAVGRRLYELRVVRRRTQADVAGAMRALGFEWRQTTVSILETGRRRVTVNEWLALATVLGCRPDELFEACGRGGVAG